MGQVTRAKESLSVEEIDQRIKTSTEAWRIRRWMIIRHALVSPQPAAEIALRLGVAKQTVHNLISLYNRKGASAVETPGKGRRQRAYMSLSEERHFLEQFFSQSAKGQVPTVRERHDALEEQLQQPVAKSTVYRLLKRHHWRKVAPRPRHPQADPSEQETFKKTFLPKSKQYFQNVPLMRYVL